MKGLLLVGHKKVPRGFGLRNGDPRNTADGAGSRGRPASRARITGKNRELAEPRMSTFFFLRVPLTGLTGQRGKEGLFWGVLRDFGILTKALSYYSKSV